MGRNLTSPLTDLQIVAFEDLDRSQVWTFAETSCDRKWKAVCETPEDALRGWPESARATAYARLCSRESRAQPLWLLDSPVDSGTVNEQDCLLLTNILDDNKREHIGSKAIKLLTSFISRETEMGGGVQDPGINSSIANILAGAALGGELRTSIWQFGHGLSTKQFRFVFDWLREQGYIKVYPGIIHVTPEGYDYIEQSSRGSAVDSQQLFLVCQFKNVSEATFRERFVPALDGTPYRIGRISDHEFNGKVDDEILLKIRSCRAVIVDIEPNNFNVGFEAGYALALGKPIIYTSQRKPDERFPLSLPFDVRVQNVIADESDEEFVRRLSNRIKITLPFS